ncbi:MULTISPECIES: hypothetical protein [Ralstonia]|uniref:Uncharacterized protein n=1 Tax=Ralstonia pickettii OR214 TaxID=1264675 RepID=R0E1S9_RALPI|nr:MULTISPECIES: hypothetical protein [Ralstonia]ENZ79593.1 hypothetical protein OR214_00009 [Ralstonia pickettii OR214]MBL4778429.1 hypothetical protein [Ralstonia sp.]MCM3582128.1 hypothetical protein [Ralstonia pickettii]
MQVHQASRAMVPRAGVVPTHRGRAERDRLPVADLSCWFPGLGFNPDRTVHTDAISCARVAGALFGLFGHA